MPSNHLIPCCPILLLPSIFPGVRVFSNESALCNRWSKHWSLSFSISPSVNIQKLFTLGLSGLISFQSKGFLRVFSNTTVQSISSLALGLLNVPILTFIHEYWKSHSFDFMDLCQQSNVSAL